LTERLDLIPGDYIKQLPSPSRQMNGIGYFAHIDMFLLYIPYKTTTLKCAQKYIISRH
jgi:hypothetical protein